MSDTAQNGKTVKIYLDRVQFHLPESENEFEVTQIYVSEGSVIKEDDPLLCVAGGKADFTLLSPYSGKISKLFVTQTGQQLQSGDALLELNGSGASTGATEAVPKTSSDETAQSVPQKVMPSVVGMIDDLSNIHGTGVDGRIRRVDVIKHMATTGPSMQTPIQQQTQDRSFVSETAPDKSSVSSVSVSAPIKLQEGQKRVPMTRMRKVIATLLKGSQNKTATLTTFNEIDFSALQKLRQLYKETFHKQHDVKLGYMSFAVKASVYALQKYPAINAYIDGSDIIYNDGCHVSVAVSTKDGLAVPVIRNAQSMSLAEIEKEIVRLAGKAREGRIAQNDMSGGTFTITNGGVFGSLLSTPILNYPQSAILGMHTIKRKPIVIDDKDTIAVRPMMYVALSYDHQIVDGKEAVLFLVSIKNAIENPERMLLGIV